MGRPLCAFLDASVLYPVSLRNLLMRLAIDDVYQPRWSAHVHEEWIRAVLRNHPHLTRAQLQAVRDGMDAHAEDALVTGYESLIDGLMLPDPDDRHVLAAAITSGSDVIVTRNIRDFPTETLNDYAIEAQHPDEFLRHLLDIVPHAVIDAISAQQMRLKNPPVSMTELLDLFERLGLTETVSALRRLLGL
jgi:hypothetical protein